jgi:serine/threonine protein kinase
MRGLASEWVVRLLEDFETPTQIVLVMEHGGEANLKQFFLKHGPERDPRRLVTQILRGVKDLHQALVMHGDLKLENIVLNAKGEVKIIDFGLSTRLKAPTDTNSLSKGTPLYLSPEIVNKLPTVGWKSDIWAVGVIIYYILTQEYPFTGTRWLS